MHSAQSHCGFQGWGKASYWSSFSYSATRLPPDGQAPTSPLITGHHMREGGLAGLGAVWSDPT